MLAVVAEPAPDPDAAAPGSAGSGAASGVAGAESLHRGLIGAVLAEGTDTSGVVVRSVVAGSAAAAANLREGDVIIGANRVRIGNLKQLREVARNASSLVLNVRRGSTLLIVPLR